MVTREATLPPGNIPLSVLKRADMARIEPGLVRVVLPQGKLLYDVGDAIDYVYFPQAGMVSLLAVTEDRKAIETATIGREGIVGAAAALGATLAVDRAVVQLPLTTTKIKVAKLRDALKTSDALRQAIVDAMQMTLAQAQTTAACNALHDVPKRLCRWILQSRDRYDGDVVPLTQQFLSEMLGVRRSSVGDVARELQSAGFIRYTRGAITILNHKALEAASCGCYATVRARAAQISPPLRDA